MTTLNLAWCVLLAMVLSAPGGATAPNVLMVIADDCTWSDLGVYGGQARTPHLDRLATQGMKFTHCFQAAPMCSPTRHCLYTGLYPVRSGAYPNHTQAYDWVKSIAHYFQSAGYHTHLSGKTHIGPQSVFPFEYSKLPNQDNPDPQAFDRVLQRSSESGQPFLFIAASNEPHSPWNRGNPAAYPLDQIRLPPILVDTPATRTALSKYLAEITYFDSQVGDLLSRLDASPHRDNTIVVVLSEQGNSLPFAKWTCYDAGLHSGCVIRWPERVAADSTTDALVEYVDMVPTLLEACGQSLPAGLDGSSFWPVLAGQREAHKEFVFGLQTSRGIIRGPEFYGIRSVRNSRFRYIRNLTPDARFQNTTVQERVFRSWQRQANAGNVLATTLVHDYQFRPAEELYDCIEDPWNRSNRIADPSLRPQLEVLRKALDAWMKQQGDEGQATEMRAIERMPGGSRSGGAETQPRRSQRQAAVPTSGAE